MGGARSLGCPKFDVAQNGEKKMAADDRTSMTAKHQPRKMSGWEVSK